MELKEKEILESYFVSYNKLRKEKPYYGKAELAIDAFTITCKVEDFATPEEVVAALKIKILEAMNRFYEAKPKIMGLKQRLNEKNAAND